MLKKIILFAILLNVLLASTCEKDSDCSSGGPCENSVCSGGCESGISCEKLKANNLTFDCRQSGPSDGSAVVFLHGFPEWSSMWVPLMRQLSAKGYRSLACNLRGYSPQASPEGVENYDYDILASDVWALAEAAGIKSFHLVGHDHGAVLGWTLAASEQANNKILSYTALSIPHIDAFSDGLYDQNADQSQQVASQYFSVFIMDNSAQMKWPLSLWNAMGKSSTSSFKYSTSIDGFEGPEAFQKSLFWYNGAMSTGVMAQPPTFSSWELIKMGTKMSLVMAGMRQLYGGDVNDGHSQKLRFGKVSIPSQYICGSDDPAILCNRPYALKTSKFVDQNNYYYLEAKCDHDLTNCKDKQQTERVANAILFFIDKYDGQKLN